MIYEYNRIRYENYIIELNVQNVVRTCLFIHWEVSRVQCTVWKHVHWRLITVKYISGIIAVRLWLFSFFFCFCFCIYIWWPFFSHSMAVFPLFFGRWTTMQFILCLRHTMCSQWQRWRLQTKQKNVSNRMKNYIRRIGLHGAPMKAHCVLRLHSKNGINLVYFVAIVIIIHQNHTNYG